jgi:hypothetical protein
MDGSLFISSAGQPLAGKMANTNFPVPGLNELPDSAASSSTEQAIAAGGHNTTWAISVAGNSTGTPFLRQETRPATLSRRAIGT